MSLIKKTLFISDLHLEEANPLSCKQFTQFLRALGPEVDALYILGDLFETWVGDDNETAFNLDVVNALKAATQRGIPIYFLCGNRDFLIGKKFLQATGCKPLNEEHKIFLYDVPVLLMHGDTLCTQDKAYLRARRILRNRFLLKLFMLMVPLSARQKFADKLRVKSKRYTQDAKPEIMDVTPQAVNAVMNKHNVQYLIHGHTHRPAIHSIDSDDNKERIVLGAWHTSGHALVWTSEGKKELIEF